MKAYMCLLMDQVVFVQTVALALLHFRAFGLGFAVGV